MLQTLRIRNYALIDDLEIEFGPGLNVLTGETGAGKSIIVGALNLVLGARASTDVVRSTAERAEIEAVFTLANPRPALRAILDEHALVTEDGQLILARLVFAEGRSKAYAAGRLVPLAVLAAIGDELVDLHGQHEHQSLLRTSRQLALLDAFAGISGNCAELAHRVRRLHDLDTQITELEATGREQVRRLEFLEFEAEEIDQADLQPGEDVEVRERRSLLANAENILAAATGAHAKLVESEDGSAAVDTLASALAALESLRDVNSEFADLGDRLQAVIDEVQTLAQDLLPFTEAEEFDPAELDRLNQRLDTLRNLKRKYGETVEDILAYRGRIEQEIQTLSNRDTLLEDLKRDRAALDAECIQAAATLSKKRQKAARRFDRLVTASLRELGMEGAAFDTDLQNGPLTRTGTDQIDFRLAANVGESPKPLKQVASGGEISRIMLALKSVFADADDVPTLIFDEIDAGIGGHVATKVAERLQALARSRQTLCITHLPQIAAAGQTHYHVAKGTRSGKTTTYVVQVEERSRIEEVARLLDGSVTDLSLNHAEDLLRKLAG